MPMLEGMTGGLIDGGALIPMNFAGRGGWRRHQGKVDGPGRGRPAGRHPRGNNRGPVWGDSVDTYGCPGAVRGPMGLVRKGVAGYAAGPGHDGTGFPRASPGGDAK